MEPRTVGEGNKPLERQREATGLPQLACYFGKSFKGGEKRKKKKPERNP